MERVGMIVAVGVCMMACRSNAAEATVEGGKTVWRDAVYAVADGVELKLDLAVPADIERPQLVVFIHGGGWRKGSKRNNRCSWVVDHGYAVASVAYRFTDLAIFPAQIHDVKAAIRWLRAHAGEYGYDATRIAVAGTSAGGHLAALLGTTSVPPALDGALGAHLDQSSAVQAVINYFGPTDFPLRRMTQPERHLTPAGGSFLLLGGSEEGGPDPGLPPVRRPIFFCAAADGPGRPPPARCPACAPSPRDPAGRRHRRPFWPTVAPSRAP